MRQLTSLDAQFLSIETSRTYGHVGSLAVYDPSTAPGGRLETADICRLVGERLHLLPVFRWRLATVPFGLDLPYWVDDPDFDLDFHIRESAVPPPGTTASWPRRWRASSPGRWIAPGRCGSSTSSRGSRAAARRC